MPKKLWIHLSVIVCTIGLVLYVAQNCGPQGVSNRSGASSSADDGPEGKRVEGAYAQVKLSIDLMQEDIAVNPFGLSLTQESVAGFVALLFCNNLEVASKITVSPIVISANDACTVGLQEINLGVSAGTFQKVGVARATDFYMGSRNIFQNGAGDQLVVEVTSQLAIAGDTAAVAFRYYQVKRGKITAKGILNNIKISGNLAPEFTVQSVVLGTSNAGTVVRSSFKCTAAFSASSTGMNKPFTCGNSNLEDLRFLFEALPRLVDFDKLQADVPNSVDTPEGIMAKLGALAAPLVTFAPETTKEGFAVTSVLPDIASGKFGGFPEQILIGVSNQRGGVSLVAAQIDIQ